MKKVTVKDLWNYFGYRRLCGDDTSLNREIHDVNVNRPGLELSGYISDKVYRRIVILGEKEIGYIGEMSVEAQERAFEYLTDDRVPMILISRDLACPEVLLHIASRKNFPVFSSFAPTGSLIVEIISFLEEYFAPVDTMHGVLLQVYGRGVMITGESGVGKSEIALELVKKGHILVADDRVDVSRVHNSIVGEAPEVLKDLIEIRGLGILDVTNLFGIASTTDKCTIDFIIHLKRWREGEEYDRLGTDNENTVNIFGVMVPQITIPVGEGRSVAAIIESAVTNQILKSKGIDSAKIFEEKIIDFINKQKEEN